MNVSTAQLQRQQTIPAQQAVCGVPTAHDLAQGLGQKLATRAVLL